MGYVDWAHGYSGPSFGTVKGGCTKPNGLRKSFMTSSLIYTKKTHFFLPCGTKCFTLFEGDVADRGASDQMREKTRVDLVDFGSLDPDHKHMKNARPSITLVKSTGCDLISQSANRGVPRGCLWTL